MIQYKGASESGSAILCLKWVKGVIYSLQVAWQKNNGLYWQLVFFLNEWWRKCFVFHLLQLIGHVYGRLVIVYNHEMMMHGVVNYNSCEFLQYTISVYRFLKPVLVYISWINMSANAIRIVTVSVIHLPRPICDIFWYWYIYHFGLLYRLGKSTLR